MKRTFSAPALSWIGSWWGEKRLMDLRIWTFKALTGENRVVQDGSEVVATIGHCVDVGAVFQEQQNRFHSTRRASVAHQRRQAGSVASLCVGSKVQKQLEWFEIVGQVDFGSEEVAFVGIGAAFKKKSRDVLKYFKLKNFSKRASRQLT